MNKLLCGIMLVVSLSGCATVCPPSQQIPFNVDESLLSPPQELQTIDMQLIMDKELKTR